MSKIGYIQALRALAVIMVVGYHFKGIIPLFKHGYLGVDLFFVICGFIMVYTTRKYSGSYTEIKEFVIKRLSRVWPVYAVLTIIFYFIFRPSIPGDFLSQFEWVIKSIMFYPYWNTMPVINSGWTLPLEIIFYLFFAFSMFAKKLRWLVLSGVMILTMLIFKVDVIYDYGSYAFPGVFIYTVSCELFWCFYIGVVLGLLHVHNIRVSRRVYEASMYFSAIIFLLLITANEQPPHGAMVGILFGLMVFGLDGLNSEREIKIPKIIIAIGNMSFSLYLCHEAVVEFFARHLDKYATDITMKLVLFMPYMAASFFLGWLSWKYLENGLAVWVRDVLMGKVKVSAELPSMDKHTKA